MKDFLMMLCIPLIGGVAGGGYIGMTAWSNERQNTANAAVFADQEVMKAVASAGYRLQADFGSPIVAYCDRRNDAGPLPCDPFPQFRGIEIRIASR